MYERAAEVIGNEIYKILFCEVGDADTHLQV